MKAYTVTYHFEFWSGTLLDITILAENEYQAERIAIEKIGRKYHKFMVKNEIDSIDIRSVKLISENIKQEGVFA